MNIASFFQLLGQDTASDPAGADGATDAPQVDEATAETAATEADAAGDAPSLDDWTWDSWNGSYWFPEQSSTFAPSIDALYDVIFWVSTVFFIIIVGAMIWFCIAYRKRPGYTPPKSTSHNTMLEIAWTVFPSMILVYFFVAGVWGFMDMRVPPDEARTIRVYAKQWSWLFVYPDGESDVHLHIPVGTPVRLQMQSDDVLHSLFVPAFRQKWDIVPGRYSETWMEATQEGEYRLYCTEYCGDSHSNMRAVVKVYDKSWDEMMDEIRWKYEDHSAIENGERLFRIQGCSGCHSIDGTTMTGPSFLNQYGTERQLTNGESVVMDDQYIMNSIKNPAGQIRAGYKNQMPTFLGRLDDMEISFLAEYIKSLNSE